MKARNLKTIGSIALCIIGAAAALSLLLSAYGLRVSRYTIEADAFTDSVRIVQLTDLHNSVFGAGNQRLVKAVAKQEPDLILITGDLLDLHEERTDIAVDLIQQLAVIAPVYISYGNHEDLFEKKYGGDLKSLYTAAGATVLEYDWTELDVNGQPLRLGGIYGYCLPPEYIESGEARPRETSFMQAFQDTERYTVLMCHMPYSWLARDALDGWDVDLVLSGHVHGGQVRFPLIGGLWAPDQGWFPGRLSGVYRSEGGGKAMLLSRGLGNTDSIPRFNNVPEVVVLDLVPDS